MLMMLDAIRTCILYKGEARLEEFPNSLTFFSNWLEIHNQIKKKINSIEFQRNHIASK